MPRTPFLPIFAGAVLCVGAAIVTAGLTGTQFAKRLEAQSRVAIERAGGAGIRASFAIRGWPARHAVLSGGETLEDEVRLRTVRAVARIPGVGGVHWTNRPSRAGATSETPRPLHCQDDVDALLRVRTIRFQEGSASFDPLSHELIEGVAKALRPCRGGIIAIAGHTNSSGPEPMNRALSLARAEAVRDELLKRGIPADGLRAQGYGSSSPIEGLEATDPANRRIEFSVIAPTPLRPTIVDAPGAR